MIRTKIVGVSFKNDDGTDRQDLIECLDIGERLYLRDMSDARFPEAIGIFNRFDEQCGNIKKELAIELREMGDFESFPVRVLQVTGGGEHSLGCNIEIQEQSVADSIEDTLKFLDSEDQKDSDDTFDDFNEPSSTRRAYRRPTQASAIQRTQLTQIPARQKTSAKPVRKAPRRKVSKHWKWGIFALCLLLGFFGVHRFYLRKKITGFVYLFTLGLFGVGWIFDLVLIATGHFTDERKLPIV